MAGTPIVAPRDYTEITELTTDDSRIEIYDSDTDSNYYIKYKTLYNNLTSKQTITLSGAIALTNFINRIELDASLGNISVSLPAPDFEGQTLEFFTTGSGIADITGTGLYVNKVYQTFGTGILRITAISATGWKAENVVSADYVSGTFTLKKLANGEMKISDNSSGVTNVSASINFFGSTSGNSYIATISSIWPVSFDNTPRCNVTAFSAGTSAFLVAVNNTGSTYQASGATPSLGISTTIKAEGKY